MVSYRCIYVINQIDLSVINKHQFCLLILGATSNEAFSILLAPVVVSCNFVSYKNERTGFTDKLQTSCAVHSEALIDSNLVYTIKVYYCLNFFSQIQVVCRKFNVSPRCITEFRSSVKNYVATSSVSEGCLR